jgi:hypothetical protein
MGERKGIYTVLSFHALVRFPRFENKQHEGGATAMATVTTKLGEKILGRVDELARERKVDREALLHFLVVRGLEQVKKERVITKYKQRKFLLEKAARVLGIDLVELVDLVRQEGLHELHKAPSFSPPPATLPLAVPPPLDQFRDNIRPSEA